MVEEGNGSCPGRISSRTDETSSLMANMKFRHAARTLLESQGAFGTGSRHWGHVRQAAGGTPGCSEAFAAEAFLSASESTSATTS